MAQFSNTLIDSWSPNPQIAKWADRQDFAPSQEMSHSALRKLVQAHKPKPVGLYIWESANHEIYIGISNASVADRLRQHVKDYSTANIQTFRYRAHSGTREELREIERELIHDAIAAGFTVFNREHSAIIYGDSVLDEDVPLHRQEEWFANPVAVNANQPARKGESDSATARSTRQFEKFGALPTATSTTRGLTGHSASICEHARPSPWRPSASIGV